MKLSRLLLLLCMLSFHSSFAKKPAYTPKAIFIQINTETNRLKYFNSKNKIKDAEILSAEVAKIKDLTMRDFGDNFSVIPVYYYNDTDLTKILAHNYDGVLYDGNNRPVATAAIAGIDSDFCIVYYGIPHESERYGHGLVVLDSKDESMKHFPFSMGMPSSWPMEKYCYVSRTFDIQYRTSARRFQQRLMKHYRFK